PVILFLIPVALAFWLCEWQVVVSFLIGIIVVPLILISAIHLYEATFMEKKIDFTEVFEVSALFSAVGLPLYLIAILTLYYALKTLSYPLVFTFPVSITVIMLTLFILITTKSWGYKEVLVILTCSFIHSYFIIWLISRFKAIPI